MEDISVNNREVTWFMLLLQRDQASSLDLRALVTLEKYLCAMLSEGVDLSKAGFTMVKEER